MGLLGVGNGPGGPPSSLSTDLRLAGLTSDEREALRDEMRQGLEADTKLKTKVSDFLNAEFGKDKAIDLQSGASPREAYTVCEYFVVLFFLFEMSVRFCDQCGAYCSDPWFGLDLLVVAQGLLDLTLPFLAGTYASLLASGFSPALDEKGGWSWILSLCRLMRVLRVLRLLRLSPRLKFLARDFVRATRAVMWVGLTVLITNFTCAIFLTSLIGQRASHWGDKSDRVDEWFGSVGKSMHTLFAVMTLSGWTEIDEVMSDVVPPVAVTTFFVLYLGACFFASLSLVTSLIGDTFMKTHLDSKEMKRQHIEEQRLLLSVALEDLLAHNSHEESFVSREGFDNMLTGNPVIFDRLRALGIRTDREELDRIFDHHHEESERQEAGLVRIDVLAEAMVGLRSDAKAGQLLDLKLVMHSLRREADMQAEAARKDRDRNQDLITATLSEQQRKTDELSVAVATLQSALASTQDDVSARLGSLEAVVKQDLHQRERREEQENTEKRDAFTGVHDKLDTMTSKLATHLQGLNTQIAQVEAKVESAVNDIAEVSTRLGGSSVSTREGTLDMGILENSGATFSGRGSISMWREETAADCDPAAASAVAGDAGHPTGAKMPTESADASTNPACAAAALEEDAAAPPGGTEVEPKLGS